MLVFGRDLKTPKGHFEINWPLLRLPLRPKLLPIIVLLLTRKLRYPGKMNGIVEKDKKVNQNLNHNVVFAREGLNLGKITS